MKNKFSVHDAAILLIDHQQGTIQLARNLPHDVICPKHSRPGSNGKRNWDAPGFNQQYGNRVSRVAAQ
jgi:hypothetical protein